MKGEEIDMEKLSDLFREKLREKNITITKLCEDLEWSRPMAAMIIHGQRRPSESMLSQIMEYLEIYAPQVPIVDSSKPIAQGSKIFISYSHNDRVFLDRLMVHLKPLQKLGLIDPWEDARLVAGDEWKQEIEKALTEARVAILLISADFLASDFIIENELPPLLKSAKEQGVRIIPLILKPCRFLRDKNLGVFQAVNSPEEPMSLVGESEQELIYDTIAQQVEDIFSGNYSIKQFQATQKPHA